MNWQKRRDGELRVAVVDVDVERLVASGGSIQMDKGFDSGERIVDSIGKVFVEPIQYIFDVPGYVHASHGVPLNAEGFLLSLDGADHAFAAGLPRIADFLDATAR